MTIGDSVLLKKEPNKLSNTHDRPFVVQSINDNNAAILYENKKIEVHKNRLIKVKNKSNIADNFMKRGVANQKIS